jgi:hypothetical protein
VWYRGWFRHAPAGINIVVFCSKISHEANLSIIKTV